MDPLNLTPDMVCLEDIAHALAAVNRFTGHTLRPYCPTLDQRVLTADLRWKPAGDLCVGDDLVGFDEHPTELGAAGTRRRRFRPSRVLAILPTKRPVLRLEMSDGSTVTSSIEHPWLVATKQSRNQKWLAAGVIATDVRNGRRRYLHKFVEPWSETSSWEIGWLAGMYDGEGHFSFVNRGGIQMGAAQRPGVVLDRMRDIHLRLGFNVAESGKSSVTDVVNMQVRGGWREALRLLGVVRPIRLVDKFRSALVADKLNKQLDGLGPPLEIVAAYEEGEQWVCGMETSSRTYICEGFGAHNSVAQHSVLVSIYCAPEDALAGLLHDASEAVLADVSSPVKHHPDFAFYREAEGRAMRAILTHFGLPPELPPSVKEADLRLLATEMRDLMPPVPPELRVDAQPYARSVHPWPAEMAEHLFRSRFRALMQHPEIARADALNFAGEDAWGRKAA